MKLFKALALGLLVLFGTNTAHSLSKTDKCLITASAVGAAIIAYNTHELCTNSFLGTMNAQREGCILAALQGVYGDIFATLSQLSSVEDTQQAGAILRGILSWSGNYIHSIRGIELGAAIMSLPVLQRLGKLLAARIALEDED